MEAKMVSVGTQNHEKPAARAPQKTLKKKHEKLDRDPISMPKTDLGRPGAKLVPEHPPRAPGMVPDPIFADLC